MYRIALRINADIEAESIVRVGPELEIDPKLTPLVRPSSHLNLTPQSIKPDICRIIKQGVFAIRLLSDLHESANFLRYAIFVNTEVFPA